MGNSSQRDIVVAGAAAAFAVDLLIYPLDTLKTRYQSRDYLQRFTSQGVPNRALFQGLYQGVGSIVLITLPAAGTFFTVYEGAKSVLSQPGSAGVLRSMPQPLMHAVASAVAELASCVVLTPAEVVKQNAQMLRTASSSSSSPAKSSSVEAFRLATAAGSGPVGGDRSVVPALTRRLLTGYSALVARNLPFTALQFPMFEALRARLWEIRRSNAKGNDNSRRIVETGLVSGGAAAVAGSIAAVATTPSDVVKTRMMLSASEVTDGRKTGKQTRQTLGAVTSQIYAENGIRGLFRGGALRAVWTALGSGLYLGVYEGAKVWLGKGRDLDDGE